MKKFGLVFIPAIVLILIFSAGCENYPQQPWPEDEDTIVAGPTATPAASSFIVAAIILAMGGMPGGSVTLMNGATPVTGATVDVNGVAFTDTMGMGFYSGTFTAPLAAGDTITLNVTSSAGNATASGTVPATGGTNNVPISGAAAGSVMAISF